MVGLGGLEPPTSPLSGARSSHLSYRPIRTLEETAYNRFILRCVRLVCNCVQTAVLCTGKQLLCQRTLLFMLKVGVEARDFQAGMANLRSDEVARQACRLHLAGSAVPECVHGAHRNAQTFADWFQKPSVDVLAQQWSAAARFKDPPGFAASKVLAKYFDGYGI